MKDESDPHSDTYVGEYLKNHPGVSCFRLGDETEGGDGVTIATMKAN